MPYCACIPTTIAATTTTATVTVTVTVAVTVVSDTILTAPHLGFQLLQRLHLVPGRTYCLCLWRNTSVPSRNG